MSASRHPTRRLKFAVEGCFNGVWGDEANGVDDMAVVRVADFNRERSRVELGDDPTVRAIPQSVRNRRVLVKGDLLIEKSGGGELQPVGNVVSFDDERPAVCSNFVARMPVAQDCESRFVAYVFRSLYEQGKNIPHIKQTSGIQNLDSESYLNEVAWLPERETQLRIANFLDDKTARIEALIAEKERLVISLASLRKSVISSIVTGTYMESGIPTGIRHYPSMASEWTFTRIKYIAKSLDGKRIPLNSEERAARQGEYPYYGASGVIDNIDGYIFDEPLVLVGEDGANLLSRATPLAFVAEGKFWVNNHAHILRPNDGRVRLWSRVIDTLDITDWVSGSAQPKLTIDALMNLPVPNIPEGVRDELEEAIVREESRIDTLISHTEEHIARLREYRSSLISAAVTGQLSV